MFFHLSSIFTGKVRAYLSGAIVDHAEKANALAYFARSITDEKEKKVLFKLLAPRRVLVLAGQSSFDRLDDFRRRLPPFRLELGRAETRLAAAQKFPRLFRQHLRRSML
jgi:hypothetical protein